MTEDRFRVPGRPLNLADRFLDANLRAGRGDKVALIVDHPERGVRRATYAEVAAAASRYGRELQLRGLGMEDRVFIILPDGFEWAAGCFGALKIGCTVMFLNPETPAHELAFYLEDSRCKGIVTNQEVAARLPLYRPWLRTVLVVDDPATESAVAAHPEYLPPAPTLEEDVAVWLWSSGSTGAPKAAVHRASDFVFNTERYPKEVLKFSEQDVTVSVPKLFFGYATGSNLLFPFFYGATAVLFPDKPTPERLFGLIARHRATQLINVPTMIARMAQYFEEQAIKPDVSSLRLLTSAGEALPLELYRRWMAGPGVEVLDGIGSAEMFHVFISARLGEVEPGSLGTLVQGYDAKIVGADGQECGPGEIGTLWIRGDSAAIYYWNRSDKSRDVLQGRWVVTGDLFTRDAKGHFRFAGRGDDLMKVAGRWVTPQEVEDALTRHPAVAEAGVTGFMQDGLLKPMAFVILREPEKPGLDQALIEHVAKALEPFKAPRRVVFVQSLPRGDRDKLDRAALKKMAAS